MTYAEEGSFLAHEQATMLLAVVAAAESGQRDEIPVGAVIQHELGWILAEAGNDSIAACDPVGHAEVRALRQAAWCRGNYRLPDGQLFVTLEPCPLCQEAADLARLSRVVFAAQRPEPSGMGSQQLAYAAASLQMVRHFFSVRRGKEPTEDPI
ncbi:MAG: nucleoside deaminase [Magnetococcales bacterium]|nr:nucleoside deaminase [Magnetococcales bacterium]